MSLDSADRSAMPENAADATTGTSTALITAELEIETPAVVVVAEPVVSAPVTRPDAAEANEAPAADEAAVTPAVDEAAVTPAVDEAAAAPAVDAAPAADQAPAADETPDAPEAPGITFADLGLAEGIVRKLNQNGVVTPFPIQTATIPDALSGRDILGRGRTGSGKTLAFGLPLLTLLSGGRTERKHPRGVILTPTRELAMQVADALQPYGDVLGLKMKVVCGGTSMQNQIYALERGVDVLVATPGRLRDLINRGAASLDQVQIAVLDEADQMADMGFLPEVTEILDLIPAGGQRLLFSATLENEIDSLVRRYLVKPVTHEVDAAQGAVTTMSHHVLVVKPKDKAPVTAAIAARKGRTIIFVRTQMGADRVAEQLIESGVRADALHGGMTQGARTRTLEDFKAGRVNVLVATDVAARGIHVDGIGLVLNVDPAADHKDYLHRSGRTARAGESGTVVSLALPHQRKQIFRLMEDAGVDASRHIIGGAGVFDEDVSRITGARSLTDVQADAVQNAAVQAEREVTDATRQLERLQRRAAELREEADRLTARSARERGEDPDEAVAAKAAELAAEAAKVVVPEPREEQSSYQRRDDRPSYGDRDRDRRDDRGSFDRRRDDRRPSYGGNRGASSSSSSSSSSYGDRRPSSGGSSSYNRDDRRPSSGGSSSYNRDDRRPSSGGSSSYNRDDRRPSSGGSSSYNRDDRRPSSGGSSSYNRDSRPASGGSSSSYGDRRPSAAPSSSSSSSYNRDDRRDSRPAYGNRGDDRPFNRDRRDSSRPSNADRDHRPSYGDRDSRPSTGASSSYNRDSRPSTAPSYGPSADRKPRWKRNG